MCKSEVFRCKRQLDKLNSLKELYGITVPSKTNLVRILSGKEEEAVTIMDNRQVFDGKSEPNSDVLILCDHATDDLKMIKPLKEEENLVKHFSKDHISADLACHLSEKL